MNTQPLPSQLTLRQTLSLFPSWLTISLAGSLALHAEDWPQWRGPDRSNASRETGLLQQWPTNGPPLLWTVTGLGNGITALAVADGNADQPFNFHAFQDSTVFVGDHVYAFQGAGQAVGIEMQTGKLACGPDGILHLDQFIQARTTPMKTPNVEPVNPPGRHELELD